ncbi:hypothetical protein J6590_101737, partial [Homalodisca vitripennis]
CDTHEAHIQTETLTETLQKEYDWHIGCKNSMRDVRKKEKDNDTPVLLFDLENVIT